MKKYLFIIILTFLYSCSDGPQATFDSRFIKANPKKELPFNELVGTYKLDKDSKKRYKISDTVNFFLEIKKDTSFVLANKINYKDRNINYGNFKFKTNYINDFKEKNPSLGLHTYVQDFNGGGTIDIYYRKNDSALVLLIYTPFVEATKENNMKYREGDYLLYIKIKK